MGRTVKKMSANFYAISLANGGGYAKGIYTRKNVLLYEPKFCFDDKIILLKYIQTNLSVAVDKIFVEKKLFNRNN